MEYLLTDKTGTLTQNEMVAHTVSVCLSVCVYVCVYICVCLSVRPSVCLFVSVRLSVCLSVRLSICVCLSVCPSVCMSVCLSVYLCLSVCLSVCLSISLPAYLQCTCTCTCTYMYTCTCTCTCMSLNLIGCLCSTHCFSSMCLPSLQVFRKLHMGSVSYSQDSMSEVSRPHYKQRRTPMTVALPLSSLPLPSLCLTGGLCRQASLPA